MTKKEAIRQLEEVNGAKRLCWAIEEDDFDYMNEYLNGLSTTERQRKIDEIFRNYMRSHKLSLIASQP
jgi:hypothetical protein